MNRGTPRKAKNKAITISVYFDKDLHRLIKERADSHYLSLSAYLRQLAKQDVDSAEAVAA